MSEITLSQILSGISSVGFPVVLALGLLYLLYMLIKQDREDRNKRDETYNQQLAKFSETLDSFNTTLTKIDIRLENLEKKQ